jgi:glycosyltransferase involved in cell wall biosynthesis
MSERHESLSVVVMARDAARELGPCLASVQGAGEVIVADTGSIDATREVAARHGARVESLQWEGFGRTRTTAFALAERDWVFWLDSDERVTPELWNAIGELIGDAQQGALSGYEVCRSANFLGRWMRGGGWGRDWVLRLFRRDAYSVVERPVHEGVVINGAVGRMEGELLHYTDPTLAHYLQKFNRYTTLAAGELQAAGRRSRLSDLLLRPPATFLRMYLLRGGLVDGLPGFILAGLSSMYVFVKYAKLWELNRGIHEEQKHLRA